MHKLYRTRNDEMAWKIYLKHSQSASAYGGLCLSPDPPGASPLGPTGALSYLKHSQSASTSGGLRPLINYRGFAPGPHRGTSIRQTPFASSVFELCLWP